MSDPAPRRRTALVTGGSRGVGAATALALARAGFDVVLTYNNKARRAEDVAAGVRQFGGWALPLQCDITSDADRLRLAEETRRATPRLDLLVLNASGGLERGRLRADPEFPMSINRDSQLALLQLLAPQLRNPADVVFVTSHWAHLYGRIEQLPSYEAVARSKRAGEDALRDMLPNLFERGIRLLVVTGDLIEGTITARLLERRSRGTTARRREQAGALVTVEDVARAIVTAVADSSLASGDVVVVGGDLEALTGASLSAAG